jgi:hypothetical protein
MKYLLAYSLPLIAFIGIYFGGFWTYSGVVFAFGILPVLELILPTDEKNYTEVEIENKLKNHFFDVLLYLNIFIVYGMLFFVLHKVSTEQLSFSEIIGTVLSLGVVLGSNGINVLSGNNSLQYVNQNSSIPMQGMIRIWGTDMQVFDGNSWQNIQSSYATVELATDTIALLQWVRDKKIEEEALLSLPSDHPAIKVAKQNLNKAKQEVKRLEEQLKITEILSKDEHETTTS